MVIRKESQFERTLREAEERSPFTPEGILKPEFRGGAPSPPPKKPRPSGPTPTQKLAEERRLREIANKKFLAEQKAKQRAEAERQAKLTKEQREKERRLRRKQQIEFQSELILLAQKKKRDLFLSEREALARKVFATEEFKKFKQQQRILERQSKTLTESQIKQLQTFENFKTLTGFTDEEIFTQIIPGTTRPPKPTKLQKIKSDLDKAFGPDFSQKILPGIPLPVFLTEKQKKAFEKETGRKVGPGASVRFSDLTGKLFSELERKGFDKERIANFIRLSDSDIDRIPLITTNQKKRLKQISKIQQQVGVGILEGIEKKPEKIILTLALAKLSPSLIARLGGSATAIKILGRIPLGVRAKGSVAISRFLQASYLASVGLRVSKTPAGLRARKVGSLLIEEVIPFEVGTRLGVRGLLRKELQSEINTAVKTMSPQRQIAFREYMKQAQTFSKFEPKVNNIKLNNIERIPNPKAQKVVRKFLTGSDGKVIVGGSVAQTGQMKVGRKLGDMDLYIDKGGGTITQQAKRLADQLKKQGIKRVSSVKGQVTIEGKKAIEFHDIERLLTNIKQVTPVWVNSRSYIVKTPEGIKIQRIGLQARRKVIASFADPKRLKTGKYKKDLKDFKKISDAIFKEASKKAKSSFFFKKKKIKAIEKIFKRKIKIKARVKKIKAKKVKIKKKKLKVKKKIKRVKKRKKRVKKKIIKRKPIRKRKRVIRKKKLTKKQLRKVRLKSLKKARAKLKKIRKAKPKKRKKLKPSQKRVKKKKRLKPSQIKAKKKKKIRPSQRPPKKRKKFAPSQKPAKKPKPPRVPRRPPFTPSQPPTKPPKPPKKPPGPPGPPKPPKKRKKILPVKLRVKKKKPKKKKLKQGYRAIGRRFKTKKIKGKKRKKKLGIILNKKLLSKEDATDRLSHAIDNTVARSGRIERVRKTKKLGKITKKESGYFQKHRKKFRKFRIVKGKRVPIKNRIIEKKGKPVIDTRGEKLGLSLAKFKKTLPGFRRKVKRRVIKKRIIIKRVIRRKIKTKRFKKPKIFRSKAKTHKKVKVRTTGGRIVVRRGKGRNKISKKIKRTITSSKVQKRVLSKKQLSALAKGRAKLKQLRKK